MTVMQSLIVLSLPRSLSSLVYLAASRSLGLRQPLWANYGEILNNDRHVLFMGDRRDSGLKFLRQSHSPALFDQVTAFLDDVVRPEGYIYKDVVHPFVFAHWKRLKDFRVLVVRRTLADVAYAVLQQQWRYPAHAVRHTANPERADILRGLILAEQALAKLPGEVVDYDDLVASEDPLQAALQRLYPEARPGPVQYIDPAFRTARVAVLARRRTTAYQELAAELEALAATMR